MPRMALSGGNTASITLDGSGNGSVRIGPQYADQIWHISNIATLVSSSALEATFNVYQGRSAGSGNFKGGSLTASNDSSDFSNVVIYHGDTIFAQWVGGDPGATATIVISGEMETP